MKDYKKKIGTADVDRNKSNDDTYVEKCNTTSQNEADTNSQYSNKRKKKSSLLSNKKGQFDLWNSWIIVFYAVFCNDTALIL